MRAAPASRYPITLAVRERHAQLGTGYWLGIRRTPRKLKIAGYREAPQFNINPFPKKKQSCCYLPLPVEGEGSRYPLFKGEVGVLVK